MNWDDLRIALAVYKGGSYAAASASLAMDETTVARRLARLQQDLGISLFEAVDGVRRPTEQCRQMLGQVDRFAKEVDRIAALKGADDGFAGTCRIATTDSLAVEVLAPRMPAFLAENPGLVLHFLASTENVNFSRWEADLAIRLRKPEKGDFLVSKLADVRFFLFEPFAPDGPAIEPMVCCYPEDLAHAPEYQYLERAGLQPLARCLTKNLLVIQSLIRSGRCSGILPEYMGTGLRNDPRFKITELEMTREVWLLVQGHLKEDPATRVVIDWVRTCFSSSD